MAEVQVKYVEFSGMALHFQGLSGPHWKEVIYLIKMFGFHSLCIQNQEPSDVIQ